MIDLKALHRFVENWTGRGYEKGDTQPFWIELLATLGVDEPTQYIKFEDQVHLDHTSFIDGFIPSTHVLIEQKSIQKDLGSAIVQSDGSKLSPFQQAKRYSSELPYSERPRWIVTCNFREFWIYDMEQPNGEPTKLLLENLEKEHYLLAFLTKTRDEALQREMEVSMKAGELVGKIYDKLLAQYHEPDNPESLRSLNQLCVRLVFLLFAEDAELFGDKNEFHDYMAQFPANKWRQALKELFVVLDTKTEDRDPYMDDDLKVFPYVNGGLFSDETIEIPQFTEELKTLILEKASADFDWSEISPTIFGGVFESTLNPETRRSGGMHYTSIENIHKVIDPLFLNELHHEFEACADNKKQLSAFQDKLASLTFFDPACGSGNFLTETYVSLRRLENKVIHKLQGGQAVLGDFANPVKVDIHQFYGIEINDFAVSVATTALWIAELQMLRETRKIAQFSDNPLPLKTYRNIHEGNALRLDWTEVIEPARLNYIIGNPPFVGYAYQSKEQKDDLSSLMIGFGSNIDYVAGWYYKTAQLMLANPAIRAALVSTNSITQGEQVSAIWKPMFEQFGIHFDFAYPTFRWDSESNLKAHVHCVIIGFSKGESKEPRRLYRNDGTYQACHNINGYLVDGPNICIEKRTKPLCSVPEMSRGSDPVDGGFLILTKEEKEELLSKEPQAEVFIRPFMMGKDFILREPRFCLWMVDADPSLIHKCPLVLQRIQKVREFRENSNRANTKAKADFPMLFESNRSSDTDYIAIPKVSSEQRRYIPIEYLSADIIAGDKLFTMPSAKLYHFGVLTSNVHMSWMRAVCGRLKSDYSYSNTIVYNNFPWPTLTEEQMTKIEQTAQAILDARASHPSCTLANLYDERTMPADLRKAHQANDRAVMAAYGFKPGPDFTESTCVARLLEMYQKLTE